MDDEFIINQDELDDSRGRRPRVPQREHWKRAFKWLVATIVLVVVIVAAYLYFNIAKISVNPFGFGKLKGESSGRVNILMLGVGDPGHDGEELSDTDIVLSVNTTSHQIAVISVPRDTQVDVPGYGDQKINAANEEGGIPLAEQVFSSTLGIPIDYYVKANFTGLEQVVDAVGGVDVNNTTLLDDPGYPCDNNQYKSCGYYLAPGHYHLNGEQALKYVRCRKGTCGNDFGRAARQQEVMQQIRQKATSAGTLSNPIRLAKLVSAAGNNVSTDLSINNLLRLDQLTKGTPQSNIYSIVFNITSDGFLMQDPSSSNLLPVGGSFSAIQNFVQNVFKFGPIWVEHPTAILENGTATVGIAGSLNTAIANQGYDVNVTSVTNAATQDQATSEIIDYSGGKMPNTLKYLEGLTGVKVATAPPTATTSPPADFVVILGNDYAAKQGAATSSTPSGATTDSPTQ